LNVKKVRRPCPTGIEHVATRCNLYSLLAPIEEICGSRSLAAPRWDQDRFGLDFYNSGWQN
jgi:hypothetical protein